MAVVQGFLDNRIFNLVSDIAGRMDVRAYVIGGYVRDCFLGRKSKDIDIVVEGKVILELKAAECITKEHEYQLINYLRATEYEVGLLLNFGKEPALKRIIFTNDRK